MYHTGLSRRPPNNQPWVGPEYERHRPSSSSGSRHVNIAPQPVFHVLPQDSHPQQPQPLIYPYGHDGGHGGYPPTSQYVPAPVTTSPVYERSPYMDYRDPRDESYSDSEPSSDSEDLLSVPNQGFHKRSYSNETRGRPVRSQSKMVEPRTRSSDPAQPRVHKPRHRKRHALRSALKEGPSPRMEVAFLPDEPQAYLQPTSPTHETETVEVIIRERIRYRSYKEAR